jgi:hypothetical protein
MADEAKVITTDDAKEMLEIVVTKQLSKEYVQDQLNSYTAREANVLVELEKVRAEKDYWQAQLAKFKKVDVIVEEKPI